MYDLERKKNNIILRMFKKKQIKHHVISNIKIRFAKIFRSIFDIS